MCLVEVILMYDFDLNYLVESHPDNSKGRTEAMLKKCPSSLVNNTYFYLYIFYFFIFFKSSGRMQMLLFL